MVKRLAVPDASRKSPTPHQAQYQAQSHTHGQTLAQNQQPPTAASNTTASNTARTTDAAAVFVSPRVVDHRAFSEYADELRELLARADEHRTAITSADTQVIAIRDRIREATGELRGRLEAITRLVPALDNKLQRCEHTLTEAAHAAELIEAAERRVETIITEKLAQGEQTLAARLDVLERRSETRIAKLEQALADAEARAQAAETKADGLAARLDAHAEAHRSGIATHTDGLIRSIEDRAHQARSSLDAALNRAASEREMLLAGVTEASAQAGESLSTLEARAETVLARVEHAERVVLPTLDDTCQKAERMLGLGTGDDEGGLPGAISQADRSISTIERLAGELGEARKVADESRTHLGHALIAASEKIKKLSEREQELSAQIAKTAELASTSETELATRAEQLRELLDAPVRQIGAQVEQAGQWLSEVIRHADDRGRALSALVERLEATKAAETENRAASTQSNGAAAEMGRATRLRASSSAPVSSEIAS